MNFHFMILSNSLYLICFKSGLVSRKKSIGVVNFNTTFDTALKENTENFMLRTLTIWILSNVKYSYVMSILKVWNLNTNNLFQEAKTPRCYCNRCLIEVNENVFNVIIVSFKLSRKCRCFFRRLGVWNYEN